MSVNAGNRVKIDVDGYSGLAGFVEQDGVATLSFPSQIARLVPGAEIRADERDWIVTKVGASPFVRGFKVVEMQAKVA